MNVFDLIGPVMIGPSSSHTAGVVRIGNVTRHMLTGDVKRARIRFHGSFSATYKGHGSDKAIVGGLMGFATDDCRIRDSLRLAEEAGVTFSFEPVDIPNAHPNTVLIDAADANGATVSVMAESVGGGNILVRRINGIDVRFDGQYDTLLIDHEDTPGAVALVTNILAASNINIARMEVYRAAKGGDAIMIIETDGRLDKALSKPLEALPHITKATIIVGLEG